MSKTNFAMKWSIGTLALAAIGLAGAAPVMTPPAPPGGANGPQAAPVKAGVVAIFTLPALGLLPPPPELGLARVRLYGAAEVGYIRLRLGEGWGGGWCGEKPIVITPSAAR